MPPTPRKRRRLATGVKVLGSLSFFALIFYKVPWRTLWAEASKLDPLTWGGVWLAFLFAHGVSAQKWRFCLSMARARIGVLDAFQCYGAGLFANLCLPSIVGGDALKAILAGRLSGRFEAAVFGGLCERLLDIGALLGLIVVGGLLSQHTIDGWFAQAVLVGALVGIAGAVLFLPLVLRVGLERFPSKLRRPLGRGLVAGRRLARRPGSAALVFLTSLALQTTFVALNMALGRGLGIDVPWTFWLLAVPLAKAITLAPISVGGFGLREVALAGLLGQVGVPPEQGFAVSLLWQSIIVASGLFGGALWFLMGLRSGARTARAPRLAARARSARGGARCLRPAS